MNCELCGSNIRGEVQAVNIDGGMFRVCNSCSKLGTAARIAKPSPNRPLRSSSNFSNSFSAPPRNFSKPRTAPPSASGSFYQDEEMMLRDDYSKVIRSAREKLGMTQDELGMKINEKPSGISHLENGSMKPNDALAKKLEHYLKAQLF